VTPTSPPPEAVPLIGQTKAPVTSAALGTPNPLVNEYGSARLDYYAGDSSTATLEGGMARADNYVAITGVGRLQTPELLRPWARFAWDAKGSSLSAWYSGFSIPQGQWNLSTGPGATSYNSNRVFHLEGRQSHTFGADLARVTVGTSAQQNEVNTDGTVLNPTYDNRSDQFYGVYAEVEVRLLRDLHLIGAARWDQSDLYAAQISPKGALVFTPTPTQAFRVSVNRAFLAPSVASLFAAGHIATLNLSAIETQLRANPALTPALAGVPNGTLFTNSAAVAETLLGNANIVPQTVTSYDVGYKGQFGRRVFLTVDAYDSRTENFTTGALAAATGLNPAFQPWVAPLTVPAAYTAKVDSAVQNALLAKSATFANGFTRLANGASAVVLSYGNAGTVDEWGVEFGSSIQITNVVTVSASYTWYNSAIIQNVANNVLVANTPHNKGSVAVDYIGRQGLNLSIDARFVDSYPWYYGVWNGPIPSTQTVDVTGGYPITPHLRFSVAATDLLNQLRYQIYGGSVIGRRVLAGLTTTF
jgi:outer membrane receptor for ferrienterochelin and colicins